MINDEVYSQPQLEQFEKCALRQEHGLRHECQVQFSKKLKFKGNHLTIESYLKKSCPSENLSNI